MKKGNAGRGSVYVTNEAGVIQAPKAVKNSPKATVRKGKDLRMGK